MRGSCRRRIDRVVVGGCGSWLSVGLLFGFMVREVKFLSVYFSFDFVILNF